MIDPRRSSSCAAPVSFHEMIRSSAWRAAFLLAGLFIATPATFAQSSHAQPPVAERQPPANAPSKGAHEAAPHFSKLEARRIRHLCHGRANEQGIRGAERTAFLSRCYFGRVSHRGVRHACQKEGAAKGLERPALRDFVRECVKERTTQKNQKEESAPTKGL